MLGGLEILALCSILGGVAGLFFRDKKTKAWIGFLLGMIGAAVVSFLLAQFVSQSLLAIPVYSILGSWLFNLVFKKISK